MTATNKVAVLGGGVAGLSAAHELIERGFDVTVYERRDVFGGKARSMTVPGSGTGGRADLPGEHGFRFFPGFYKHLTNTLTRIPFGNGTCNDNLVEATQALLARNGRPEITWQGCFPKNLSQWETFLNELFTTNLDIPADQVAFFVRRLMVLATSCDARYLAQFENSRFWDFIRAEQMCLNYQRYLGEGFTRSLVAMQAEVASTRTVGRILWQLFYGIFLPDWTFDRLLNGPTNDVWLLAWVKYLTGRGVKFVSGAALQSLDVNNGALAGATIEQNGTPASVQADYYVCAVPVEVMQTLLTPALCDIAPSLANLGKLQTAWMNGIQFYLHTDEPLATGHSIYLDSNWALTAISQRQFWSGYDLSKYGNGQVGGILSVDISNWTAPGNFDNTPAKDCTTREQIKNEVWAQLKAALNNQDPPQIVDSNLIDWFLDPDIVLPNPPGVPTNCEPLLINYAGSLQYRPNATTEIPNLFLASDYVQTNTDLATMEGANEAARRAVNGILTMSRSNAPPCQLFTFSYPAVVEAARDMDKIAFAAGLPNFFDLLPDQANPSAAATAPES